MSRLAFDPSMIGRLFNEGSQIGAGYVNSAEDNVQQMLALVQRQAALNQQKARDEQSERAFGEAHQLDRDRFDQRSREYADEVATHKAGVAASGKARSGVIPDSGMSPEELGSLPAGDFAAMTPPEPTASDKAQALQIARSQFAQGNFDLEQIAKYVKSQGLKVALQDIAASGATSVEELDNYAMGAKGGQEWGPLVDAYFTGDDALDEEGRGRIIGAMPNVLRAGGNPMDFISDRRNDSREARQQKRDYAIGLQETIKNLVPQIRDAEKALSEVRSEMGTMDDADPKYKDLQQQQLDLTANVKELRSRATKLNDKLEAAVEALQPSKPQQGKPRSANPFMDAEVPDDAEPSAVKPPATGGVRPGGSGGGDSSARRTAGSSMKLPKTFRGFKGAEVVQRAREIKSENQELSDEAAILQAVRELQEEQQAKGQNQSPQEDRVLNRPAPGGMKDLR